MGGGGENEEQSTEKMFITKDLTAYLGRHEFTSSQWYSGQGIPIVKHEEQYIF